MMIQNRPEFQRKTAVLTMAPGDFAMTAIKVMSAKNFGAVIIISPEDKPLGIVTERDFMRRLLNEGRDPTTTLLGDIMTTDLKVARKEDNILDWLRQMSNDRFRHLPIVDETGKLTNIMSQGDFVSYTWPELLDRLKDQSSETFKIAPSVFSAILGIALFAIISLMLVILKR